MNDSVSYPNTLDRLCGRFPAAVESNGPLTAEDKSGVSATIARERLSLSRMKGHAKVLRKQVFSKHPTNHFRFRLEIAGKVFCLPVKKRMPVAHRMAMYVELHELERKIVLQQNKVTELEKPLRGRAKRGWDSAKMLVNSIISEVRHFGAEGRSTSVGIGSSPFSPTLYVSAALDTLGMLYWAANGVLTLQQVKNIKGLIEGGAKRLSQVENALKTLPPGSDEAMALEKERTSILKAMAPLREELDRRPVASIAKNTLTSAIRALDSYARIIQAVAAIAPLMIKTGQSAMATVGTVAGAATLPLSVFLCCRGISGCIANLGKAMNDRRWASGVLAKDLPLMRNQVLSLVNLSKISNLDLVPDARDDIASTAERIIGHQKTIKRMQLDILNGAKSSSPEWVEERKRISNVLQLQIIKEEQQLAQRLLHRIAECEAPEQIAVLEEARCMLRARLTLAESMKSMESTFLPYVEQETKVKMVLESLRILAEGMMLASSVALATGLFLSTFYGAGMPLLAIATLLGLGSIAIQYPVSILVEKLAKVSRGKQHIPKEQVETELANRLRAEVKEWENLEHAGMAQCTASSLMFALLSPHYDDMPQAWGAKEWAAALADDPPNGKHWQQYRKAVSMLRYHDEGRNPADRLINWIALRIKKVVSSSA